MIEHFKKWHRALSNNEVSKVYLGEDVKCGCWICEEREK